MPFLHILTSGKPASLSILFLLLLIPLPPLGSDEIRAEEVSLGVTATTPNRLDEPVENASGSVSVLTQPEIEARNPVTAPEVLKDLPGVNLQESGTIGESAALTLRGAEPSQTLILLDGVRLNSPFRGDFDLGNLLIDEIGQIEVVRGAQSALYGSDAMGGVVNLRTKKGSGPPSLSLTEEIGNEKTFREILSMSGGRPMIDYSVTLSRTDTDGQFDRDRFGASTFAGQIGFPVRGAGRIELSSRFQSDHKELATDIFPISPTTVQVVSDKNDEIRRSFLFQTIQYTDRILPRFDLSWKSAILDTNLNWDNPPDPASANSYFENTMTRTLILDLQQNIYIGNADIFTFGFERARDFINSDISDGASISIEGSRDNAAYYLQNLIKQDRQFSFQAGVRLDNNSSFGTIINPKVSAAYEFQSTGSRLRASWGRGFRAPTIQELFFPVFGNPDLKPEKSRSWEIGVQQKIYSETVTLDAAFFRIDYDDLIQISPTGVSNIGKARTQGVESALEIHPWSSFTVKANYTYLDAEDRVTGNELPFRPRHRGNISLLYLPTLNLVTSLDINMVSSQDLSADFILKDGSLLQGHSPGYTSVDLSVSYHLFKPLSTLQETKFFIKIKNLFNREYQEVPGFPSPGVNFLAGITATL